MSWVTTLIIHFSTLEDQSHIDQLANWIRSTDSGDLSDLVGTKTKPVGEWGTLWGGNKLPQARVWGGAYNRFDFAAFIQELSAIRWLHPDALQVFAKFEEDRRFRVFLHELGTWREVVDGSRTDPPN